MEAVLAPFVYLVLFSYAFFFKGFTGLAITIGAIVTLLMVMQLTARVNRAAATRWWREVRYFALPIMRKKPRPEKVRTMTRSILPSKNRESARTDKALRKRAVRRIVRTSLRIEDFELTRHDLLREADLSDVVRSRQVEDKLHHFMRWCRAITAGMDPDEALGYVRGLLPKNLIGDHAFVHWEIELQRHRDARSYVPRRERRRRESQSAFDSWRFRLHRVLACEPHRLGELNAAIKASRPFDEERRLLLGIHDVDAFVATILSHAQYDAERRCTRALIANKKGGREGRPFICSESEDQEQPLVLPQFRHL
ncbi:MAG: hypothetical protein JOZ54_23845 [Acidobacteria bacterium]|nr:hypothetical protein [Acidobacteriota bacterium]